MPGQRRPAELALPIGVTDHRDGNVAPDIRLVRVEQTPDGGTHAEEIEVSRVDVDAGDLATIHGLQRARKCVERGAAERAAVRDQPRVGIGKRRVLGRRSSDVPLHGTDASQRPGVRDAVGARRSTRSAMRNTAELIPSPSASVAMTPAVNAGLRPSPRRTNRASCRSDATRSRKVETSLLVDRRFLKQHQGVVDVAESSLRLGARVFGGVAARDEILDARIDVRLELGFEILARARVAFGAPA